MIAVVGSCNVDLVITVGRLPSRGETVSGDSLVQHLGGKGANQAVACARLGARTSLYAVVGSDEPGRALMRSFQEERVDTRHVKRIEGVPTGTANIWVEKDGGNSIVYIPGANAFLNLGYVKQVFPHVSDANVVLLQLETPLSAVVHLLRCLAQLSQRPKIILDPAPAQSLTRALLAEVDVLTPNESEITALTGTATIKEACYQLRSRGARAVVCKMGKQGAVLSSEGGYHKYPAFPVRATDTTGAGDAFNAGLAYCLNDGIPIEEAIVFANACGALATTSAGAQPSLPTIKEVRRLLMPSG